MPIHKLIGLEHAQTFADHKPPGHKGKLQGPFRGLPACPGMVFIHQDIVVNIADRQRAAGPDACQHLAQIALGYRIEPAFWRLPMKPHRSEEPTSELQSLMRIYYA